MLPDRNLICIKEPIDMHLKLEITHYSRTVYTEKFSTPPPPKFLCFCETVNRARMAEFHRGKAT
jgi:hypothetical protein